MDLQLLADLIKIPGASGDEHLVRDFILNHVKINAKHWKVMPKVYTEDLMDCIVLCFGKPRLAAFAHMDTTGFMVRYLDQLIPVGSPEVNSNEILVGKDALGEIECSGTIGEDDCMYYKFGRAIQSGTYLTYKPTFEIENEMIHAPYLDNRAGVFNLLTIAETIENGLLVFSCMEEHGGGTVPLLCRFLYEKFEIKQALVSDITWATEGVHHGEGVAISLRDRNIPRRSFVQKLMDEANALNIPWQVEVEASGSSDGREINQSPYPIDWCFVGAPQSNPHSSSESIHISDLKAMIDLYQHLFKTL